MKVKSESEVAQSCPTLHLRPHGLQPTRLLRPWDFPGKSTGVGCHRLLCREGIHLGKGSQGSRAGKSLQVAHQVGSGGVGWRRGMEPKLEPSGTLTEPGKGGAGQRRAWEGLS